MNPLHIDFSLSVPIYREKFQHSKLDPICLPMMLQIVLNCETYSHTHIIQICAFKIQRQLENTLFTLRQILYTSTVLWRLIWIFTTHVMPLLKRFYVAETFLLVIFSFFICCCRLFISSCFYFQAKPEDFHYLTRIHYENTGDGIWGEHEIDYILFLHKNVDLCPNPNEVSEIRYIKREQLDNELLSLQAPLTPWFNLILKYRLKLWWDNLNSLKNFEDFDKIHKLE